MRLEQQLSLNEGLEAEARSLSDEVEVVNDQCRVEMETRAEAQHKAAEKADFFKAMEANIRAKLQNKQAPTDIVVPAKDRNGPSLPVIDVALQYAVRPGILYLNHHPCFPDLTPSSDTCSHSASP